MRPEHIAEPGKRIDSCQFAGRNETAQHSRCSAAVVATEEGPVVTTHREAPQRPLMSGIPSLAIGRVPAEYVIDIPDWNPTPLNKLLGAHWGTVSKLAGRKCRCS